MTGQLVIIDRRQVATDQIAPEPVFAAATAAAATAAAAVEATAFGSGPVEPSPRDRMQRSYCSAKGGVCAARPAYVRVAENWHRWEGRPPWGGDTSHRMLLHHSVRLCSQVRTEQGD